LLAVKQATQTGELRLYLEILSLVGFLIVLIWMLAQNRYRRQWDLMLYSAATLGLFMSRYDLRASVYLGATRYVLSIFPVFIGIADLVQRLPPRGRKLYMSLSLAGFLVVSALYALFVFVG
jgi:hypothetical protein